jgi:hypothetical protein
LSGTRKVLVAIVLAISVVGALAGAGVLQAAPSGQSYPGLSFRLQGCDLPLTTPLPNGGGKFICPDADYTDGNLGKNWNELDLVPHRILISAGNSAPALQTYSFQIAADYSQTKNAVTHLGYDFIEGPSASNPTGLEGASAACQGVQVSTQQSVVGTPPGDQVVFRTITVTQAANTTCQLDLYLRLGIGAHLFSGSSLHSQLLNDPGTGGIGDTSGIGEKTNSIPTNEIAPQSIAKDMSAARNTDHTWNVVKGATPASLDFGNVCAPGFSNTAGVGITVTWTRNAATPSGDATITTHVYATNPSHREITTNVSDKIYEGAGQSVQVGSTATSGDIDVPPNTAGFLILTDTQTVPSSASSFNDVATATYTDKVTGIPVPGTTSAVASASVASGTELNGLATITDTESITGSGLTFKTATPSPVAGTFLAPPVGGYVAGTYTTGPVNWSSGSQPGSGNTTFSKTVKLDPKQVTSGVLTDTASLSGSNGFSTSSAPLSVNITSSATTTLTITKTIPNILQGNETQSFSFKVLDASNNVVATTSVSFVAGETSKSVDVSGLAPGTYTVTEDTATGWNPQNVQNVDLTLPDHCSNTVTFNNSFGPAVAKAVKVTDPAGGQAGWTFTLTRPDASTLTGTTNAAGNIIWAGGSSEEAALPTEGAYTITETSQPGYAQVSASADCSFTVSYPADFNRTFTCTITNRADATLQIVKVTDPVNSGAASFPFTSASTGVDPSFSLDTNPATAAIPSQRTFTFSGAAANFGSKSVAEGSTAGWSLTGIDCGSATNSGSGSTATVTVNPGDHVVCTFTNKKDARLTITKVTAPVDSGTDSFPFTTSGSGISGFALDTQTAGHETKTFTFSGSNYGVKQVTEGNTTGWTLTNVNCGTATDSNPSLAGVTVDVQPGDNVTCTYTNKKDALLDVVKVTDPANSGNDAFSFTGADLGPFTLDTNGADGTNPSHKLFTFSGSGYGDKTTTEGSTTGWNLQSVTCQGGTNTGSGPTLTVNMQPGDVTTCTFTNKSRGTVKVVKTLNASAITGTQPFQFELRLGSQVSQSTAAIETKTASSVNSGILNFTTQLVPGQTYAICELLVATFGPDFNGYGPYNPADNPNYLCLDFKITTAQAANDPSVTFNIDNTHSNVGALTIGYWKTHAPSSCKQGNGGQGDFLTGAMNLPGGIALGPYQLTDPCKAVNLLSKLNINGQKESGEIIYSMVAQLVAANLNLNNGAGGCTALTSAITSANNLLNAISFNGIASYQKTLTAAQQTLAASLNDTLDKYNNNNLC